MKKLLLTTCIFFIYGCSVEALTVGYKRSYNIPIITPWEVSSFAKEKLPEKLDSNSKKILSKCTLYRLRTKRIIPECEPLYKDLRRKCLSNINTMKNNEKETSECVGAFNMASIFNNEKFMEVVYRKFVGSTNVYLWRYNKVYFTWMTLNSFRPIVDITVEFDQSTLR